jgi:Tn3 transposase DDE domain
LMAEGYPVKREDVAALSPYLTRHIKRFGDYFVDLSTPHNHYRKAPYPCRSEAKW